MIATLTSSTHLLASSSSNGDGIGIAWLLLFAGVFFYAYVFFRYRNADKRHLHESETDAKMLDIQAADEKSGRVRGQRSSRMSGANNNSVKGSQHVLGRTGKGQDAISSAVESIFKR